MPCWTVKQIQDRTVEENKNEFIRVEKYTDGKSAFFQVSRVVLLERYPEERLAHNAARLLAGERCCDRCGGDHNPAIHPGD